MYKQGLGVVCIFSLFMTVVQAKPASPCLGIAKDILFVLDSSSSIWIEDYKKQLKFVADFVDRFKLEERASEVRVGIITFSDQAYLEFPLGHLSEPAQMKKAISNIIHRTGGTNTADALKVVRSQVKTKLENRDGPIVAIVVTDGKSSNRAATTEEAKKLHQLGINVYAIGVGDRDTYDINELKAIASDPVNGVYTVASYSVLKEIAQKLHRQPCDVEVSTPEPTTVSKEASSTTTTQPSATRPLSTTTGKPFVNIVESTATEKPSNKPFEVSTPVPTTISIAKEALSTTTTGTPMNIQPESLQKDKDSTIIFGYDIMSMGSFRVNMISQFINTILSHGVYEHFGVISYAYCPVEFNIPVISLKNKKPSELQNSVKVNINLPGLTEIVRQIRSVMYTRAIKYVQSGHIANQIAVLFVDPSVTVITTELLEETAKLKQQGVEVFVISVGKDVWPHPQYLNLISSQPYVNYFYSYPTYAQLLYSARYRPFPFRAMCNPCTPNI